MLCKTCPKKILTEQENKWGSEVKKEEKEEEDEEEEEEAEEEEEEEDIYEIRVKKIRQGKK